MGITYGDYLIDSGYYDPPEEETMAIPIEAYGDGEPKPKPIRDDIRKLSNRGLAEHLAAMDSDYDGVPDTVREALIRLLLYYSAFEPPKR